MGLVGKGWVNCFRTHNELTMGLLGKYPLTPSVRTLTMSGLPIQVTDFEKIWITGLDGEEATCVGKIVEAKIYVTESNLEAVGDLIVIKEGAFDFLLG